MKLLLVNQYYRPDLAATAQVLSDLCEHLAAAGHDVHVLCSRGKYDDGTGSSTRLPRRETMRGVHVHRVTATGFGKGSMLGRAVDYASFHLLTGLRMLLCNWRYDVVVTLTTPPLIGLYATVTQCVSRHRHVCWVMDLHPDVEFELGVLRPTSFLGRAFRRLNRLELSRATRCVALGQCMKRRIADKGVDESRIDVIPVWSNIDTDVDDADVAAMREQFNVRGKFVIMYSGNAGLIHSFEAVLDAAKRLGKDDRVAFLFVGGGRRFAEIEAFREQHGLSNIIIHPYVPADRLAATLRVGDVHLVTLRDGMQGAAVPSKLYGILAVGRPVLYVGPPQSDAAMTVTQHGTGVALPVTSDGEAVANAITHLRDEPDLRRDMAAAARQVSQTYCSRERSLAVLTQMLEDMANA